jgi:nucleotide-binding universal stress UspA family protein
MDVIVVGYDDTGPAKQALERAAELALAFGAKVIVTSVAHVFVGRGIGPVDPIDPPEVHREALENAAAVLAERGVSAEYDLAMGDPAGHIVQLAEHREADLIVVGTREPGLIERMLGLSVSGAVQSKAHCDVLVVHEG